MEILFSPTIRFTSLDYDESWHFSFHVSVNFFSRGLSHQLQDSHRLTVIRNNNWIMHLCYPAMCSVSLCLWAWTLKFCTDTFNLWLCCFSVSMFFGYLISGTCLCSTKILTESCTCATCYVFSLLMPRSLDPEIFSQQTFMVIFFEVQTTQHLICSN